MSGYGSQVVSKTTGKGSIPLIRAKNEQVANIGIGTGLQNLKYEFDSHSVLYGAEANLVEAKD